MERFSGHQNWELGLGCATTNRAFGMSYNLLDARTALLSWLGTAYSHGGQLCILLWRLGKGVGVESVPERYSGHQNWGSGSVCATTNRVPVMGHNLLNSGLILLSWLGTAYILNGQLCIGLLSLNNVASVREVAERYSGHQNWKLELG